MLSQASEDLRLRVWDVRAGLNCAVCELVGHNNIITCCDVAVEGDDMMFVSSSNGFDGAGCEVMIWDRRMTSKPLHACSGHTETVSGCCFIRHSTGLSALSVSADNSMRVWNSLDASLQNTTSFRDNKRVLCCSNVRRAHSKASSSEALVATGGIEGSMCLWSIDWGSAESTNTAIVLSCPTSVAGKKNQKSESVTKAADVSVSYSSSAAAAAVGP
jgi:WD40 repeat protein